MGSRSELTRSVPSELTRSVPGTKRVSSAGSSVLLVGGARSGKSTLAQALATRSGLPVTVAVTAEALDDEMAERIERHRADRPDGWVTVEAPFELVEAIAEVGDGWCLIIDCVTVWLSNLLLAGWRVADIDAEVTRLAWALVSRSAPTVVVSNEVGQGIVPAEAISRTFRDIQGRANQSLATALDRSYLVVAGRALPLSAAEEITL